MPRLLGQTLGHIQVWKKIFVSYQLYSTPEWRNVSAVLHDRGIERIGGQSAIPGGVLGNGLGALGWGPLKAKGPQLATLKVLTLKAG